MSSSKSRIYFLFTGLIVLGYSWIIATIIGGEDSKLIVCPIKMISGYPCPSCGSTRSVIKFFEGEFIEAINSNPFGLIIFAILLICPVWLIYDFLSKEETLWIFYNKVESFIRKRKIAIPLVLLVIANWIWNICKGI